MRILVVGASGFIGKNLLVPLAEKYREVIATFNSNSSFPAFVESLDTDNIIPERCDLRDEENVKNLFTQQRDFAACIYLASDTRVGYLSSDPSSDVLNNILPMVNFLKHYNGGEVIFFSSGAIYMGQRGAVSHANLQPSIPYAISKYSAELYLKHRALAKGFGYLIIRFFGAYGPYEPERKITRKLLLAVDSSDARKIPFTVYGDGNNLIDVMFVDDTVDAILRVLQSGKNNLTVDLCGDSHVTVNDYVVRVAETFEKTVRINHEGSSAEYIEFYASNEGFSSHFEFSPSISLENGLKRYMAWLRRSATDQS